MRTYSEVITEAGTVLVLLLFVTNLFTKMAVPLKAVIHCHVGCSDLLFLLLHQLVNCSHLHSLCAAGVKLWPFSHRGSALTPRRRFNFTLPWFVHTEPSSACIYSRSSVSFHIACRCCRTRSDVTHHNIDICVVGFSAIGQYQPIISAN